VSGGRPLENLRPVVEEIEHGRVDVLVGAYFDRLFRNLREQGEVVDRIERRRTGPRGRRRPCHERVRRPVAVALCSGQ
jgi:hypothetical protein